MADTADQGGGGEEDPRIDLLKQYCLKTLNQVCQIHIAVSIVSNVKQLFLRNLTNGQK